jgi:uncharacterized membrane protein
MRDPSYKRHILKAITWRIVGTVDTVLLAWMISGEPLIGLKIGGSEVLTKIGLYYLHERVWFKVNLSKSVIFRDSRKRHLIKTISWRIIGTLDTMLLAWWISGNPLIGLKVGFVEVLSKMLLYYLHERLWFRMDYGLDNRTKRDA